MNVPAAEQPHPNPNGHSSTGGSAAFRTLTALAAGGGLVFEGVAVIFFLSRAPAHHTLGSTAELLPVVLSTLALCVVSAGALGGAAWALHRAKHRMASQLTGLLAVTTAIAIWQSVDAANVIFDGSTPTAHPTKVVDTYSRKNSDYAAVTSWRPGGGTISVRVDRVGGWNLRPGDPATLVIAKGAFGRPYALSLEKRAAQPAASEPR